MTELLGRVGNDRRDRTFNPEIQAARYDADGRFRRLWLQRGSTAS